MTTASACNDIKLVGMIKVYSLVWFFLSSLTNTCTIWRLLYTLSIRKFHSAWSLLYISRDKLGYVVWTGKSSLQLSTICLVKIWWSFMKSSSVLWPFLILTFSKISRWFERLQSSALVPCRSCLMQGYIPWEHRLVFCSVKCNHDLIIHHSIR